MFWREVKTFHAAMMLGISLSKLLNNFRKSLKPTEFTNLSLPKGIEVVKTVAKRHSQPSWAVWKRLKSTETPGMSLPNLLNVLQAVPWALDTQLLWAVTMLRCDFGDTAVFESFMLLLVAHHPYSLFCFVLPSWTLVVSVLLVCCWLSIWDE